MAVSVSVEEVDNRELPQGYRDPSRFLPAGELVLVVFHVLLSASQVPHLANEEARQCDFGAGTIHPIDFAVGETCNSQSGAYSFTGKNLRIQVNLGALP